MRSFARRLIAAGAMLAVLMPAGYAAAETAGPVMDPETNPVVARINDKDIDFKSLQSVVSTLMPLMSYHSSVSDSRLRQLRKTALDKIIDDQLIYADLVKSKAKMPTKKEINEEIDSIKKRVPPGKTLDDMLKDAGMTMKEFRSEVEVGFAVKHARQDRRKEFKKQAEATVTEKFMRDYYDKNLDKFKEPEKVHVREILLKADPSGGQKVWQEAKKRAIELKTRIEAGEDFVAMAKELSEDTYAEQGGDMGWAHLGSLSPEIEETIKSLKAGEVGGPVMSIYGYHLVKLEAREESKQKAFKELNLEKLGSELKAKESRRQWDEWITGLRSTAKIELLSDLVR